MTPLNRTRRPAGFLLVAGGLAVLAACSGGPSPGAPTVISTTTAAPATTAGGSGGPTGTTVTVDMSEFKFGLSQATFPAGTYTFVAKNVGSMVHVLEIKGPGVTGQKTDAVQPGQSASLTVTLQNGTYEMWCPVDGHKGQGMDTTITVGSGGPPPPKTTTGDGGGGGGYGY